MEPIGKKRFATHFLPWLLVSKSKEEMISSAMGKGEKSPRVRWVHRRVS